VDDADADASNEIQTLSKLGNKVSLSNGGGSFTDAVDDADASTTNEIQHLSLVNDKISLSNSSDEVDITDISPWTISSGNATKFSGQVGIGITIPEAKLDIISDAGEDGLRVRINNLTKLRVLASSGTTIGGNPGVAPNNGLYVHGNTGLGTTSATEKLEIVGALNLSGNASSNNPDAGTIRWNDATLDFEGYDGTNWKSLTGLPAPPPPPSYEVGDFEDEGVVFFVSPDGKTVKFVYIGEIQNVRWSSPWDIEVDGSDNNFDGFQNTLDIISDPDINSSAAEICANLTAGGHSDWYLPAINELEAIYIAKPIIDTIIEDNLGDIISNDSNHWSSTEFDFTQAKSWTLNAGERNSTKSSAGLEIRAIRTITLP